LKHNTEMQGGAPSVTQSFQKSSSQTKGHSFSEKPLCFAYNCV